jgi:hypothetical protein
MKRMLWLLGITVHTLLLLLLIVGGIAAYAVLLLPLTSPEWQEALTHWLGPPLSLILTTWMLIFPLNKWRYPTEKDQELEADLAKHAAIHRANQDE